MCWEKEEEEADMTQQVGNDQRQEEAWHLGGSERCPARGVAQSGRWAGRGGWAMLPWVPIQYARLCCRYGTPVLSGLPNKDAFLCQVISIAAQMTFRAVLHGVIQTPRIPPSFDVAILTCGFPGHHKRWRACMAVTLKYFGPQETHSSAAVQN